MTNEPPKSLEWWADGQQTVQFLFPKAHFSYVNESRLMEPTSSAQCINVSYITPSRLVPHSEQNLDVSRQYAEPHSSQYLEGPVA